MFKVPESMYSKGPKDNPAPAKSWDTSGSRAYGNSEIRMLNPEPEMPKMGSIEVKVIRKKRK